MRIVLVFALFLVAAQTAAAVTPRVEHRDYDVRTALQSYDSRLAALACSEPLLADGACFVLDGSETRVQFNITDASGLWTCPNLWFFDSHLNDLNMGGHSCAVQGGEEFELSGLGEGDPMVVVPFFHDSMTVWQSATVGTITATFS